MFLLIISVYFLCIIVVEKIQVEFARKVVVFFLISANKTPGENNWGFWPPFPFESSASFCPQSSLLKLYFIIDFPRIQPTLNYRQGFVPLTEGWMLPVRETPDTKIFSSRVWEKQTIKPEKKFIFFFEIKTVLDHLFKMWVYRTENTVHVYVSIERIISILRNSILQRRIIQGTT